VYLFKVSNFEGFYLFLIQILWWVVLHFVTGWCVPFVSDPYLNTDAGTMSPIEHGEVYVLDDGGEVHT
jgi:hypothetical protein